MQTDLPLNRSQRTRLDRVYRKAEYQVSAPQRGLVFRIGTFDPVAEMLLRKQVDIRHHWSILTPCNPRSQEASEQMNSYYYHELRDALAVHNGTLLRTINHDPTGSWPDEPGFLIADADPDWLARLGLRFRQNAYLSARIGEALRLVWLA